MHRSDRRGRPRAAALLASVAAFGVLVGGCRGAGSAQERWARAAAAAGDNPELAQLYAAAAADAGVASPENDSAVQRRHNDRFRRARALVRRGAAHTATDYSVAALLAMNAADTVGSPQLAYEWARSAYLRDSVSGRTNARSARLMATAWDAWQLSQKRPQWYGTHILYVPPKGPWQLYDVDTTHVSDADRVRLGLPTLAERRAEADSLNRGVMP